MATLRMLRPLTAEARGRLVCFPCAGASAAFYRAWLPGLPAPVQPVAVELAGRGSRFGTPPAVSLAAAATEVASALEGLDGPPIALFGHSMGAIVAFEVARVLERAGPAPTVLFASSALPPHRLGRSHLHELADGDFVAELAKMDGIPEEALAHPELMDLVLPVLRADITALERHPPSRHRIDAPVVAMGGRDDRNMPPGYLSGWAEHTRSSFEQELFPGEHFYLLVHADLVAGEVGRRALESFAC